MSDQGRVFTRIPLPFGATLIVDGRTYSSDHGGNVSATGIFIEMDDAPPVHSECEIHVQLHDAEIVAGGTVVRSDASGVGIRFSSLSPESLPLLLNLVRYNAEDPEAAEREFTDHLRDLVQI